MTMPATTAFADALVAPRPHPSLGAHAETYGRVIGHWSGQLSNHMQAGPPAVTSVEVVFAWALDGRAVQDVWITPARSDRKTAAPAAINWYGTTLRLFDARSEAWRANWLDPVSGLHIALEGRRVGDDIVQLGTRGGRPIRWTFSEIEATSFLWQGHVLEPDGVTWRLEVAMRFRRVDG
jgi:hypothetical protein